MIVNKFHTAGDTQGGSAIKRHCSNCGNASGSNRSAMTPTKWLRLRGNLQHAGLPMWEFPQTIANLTESSTNLVELIKGGNLVAYPDPDLKLAVSRAVALESARGGFTFGTHPGHRF